MRGDFVFVGNVKTPTVNKWETKMMRLAIGFLYRLAMLLVLDGEECPTDHAEAADWKNHNNKLFSIILFATSGSVNTTVKDDTWAKDSWRHG